MTSSHGGARTYAADPSMQKATLDARKVKEERLARLKAGKEWVTSAWMVRTPIKQKSHLWHIKFTDEAWDKVLP